MKPSIFIQGLNVPPKKTIFDIISIFPVKQVNLIEYPTTRYQGSKRKILSWIYNAIKDLKFETALDAFGGSSSVSYLLKKMNKAVTYNDKLRFNYHIGKAIIENSRITISKQDLVSLNSQHENIDYPGIIQKHFKDIYFLQDENAWLDMVTFNIVNMNHYSEDVLQYKKSLAYYALFQASIVKRPFNLFHRRNLNIRTADVERNFGNKSTWDRSFDEYFIRFAEEANSLVFDSGKPCNALNKSALDVDPYGYDLVYLDPPYLRRDGDHESSNYLQCYHFLEGLSNYQIWEELIDFNSRNLRFRNDIDNNDFLTSSIYETYERLITKFQKSTIVLSYKVGGIPSIEFLKRLVKKVKGNVHTCSLHYVYALNKQNGNAKKNREVLIIGI